jgi:hypothetical protein
MREPWLLPVLIAERPAAFPAQPEAAESCPAKSRRSMWRRLVRWVGRADSGDTSATASSENQPELQPFRRSEPDQPETTFEPSEPKVEAGGRFALLTGYNPFNRAEKKTVQAEFRFENVRVVCNELHDTDFIIKT